MKKNQIVQLLKKSGVEFDETEIKTFSSAYNKLAEAKGKITKKEEKKNFNKVLKLFSELDDDSDDDSTLFPNKIPEEHFAIVSAFTDNYTNALNTIDQQRSIVLTRYGRSKKEIVLSVSISPAQSTSFFLVHFMGF